MGARILVVAPFKRGLAHGGSQRATAMAERLEARGITVDWAARRVTRGNPLVKSAALARGVPEVVRENTASLACVNEELYDSAIAAHSYMAPHVLQLATRQIVDFHNLEWKVLDALGRRLGGARGAYKQLQARLMREHETAVLRSGADAVFVSQEELAWGDPLAHGATLAAPNLLPRAAEDEALRIAAMRGAGGTGRFAYVGTLTFPPNVASLLSWLSTHWPGVRAAVPGATLAVAGRCSDEVRAAIGAFEGVTALGFVEDLTDVLAEADAAILPFEGEGGSSLRFLHFALARVPVVATSGAERGLPFSPGLLARTTGEWADVLGACVAGDSAVAGAIEHADDAARSLHDDPAPWDALADLVRPRPVVRDRSSRLGDRVAPHTVGAGIPTPGEVAR
jgi:hypothetical protein